MILSYQTYKNISGKFLQYPLRISDEFKIVPNGTVTVEYAQEAEHRVGNIPGFVVTVNDYQGNFGAYRHCWMPPEFIMANFELVPPPLMKNQIEMFHYVWDTRPHKSQLTDLPLLDTQNMQWHHQFLHILPKGTYKHWKLNAYNILLARPEEHDIQERFPYFLEVRQALTLEYHQKYR